MLSQRCSFRLMISVTLRLRDTDDWSITQLETNICSNDTNTREENAPKNQWQLFSTVYNFFIYFYMFGGKGSSVLFSMEKSAGFARTKKEQWQIPESCSVLTDHLVLAWSQSTLSLTHPSLLVSLLQPTYQKTSVFVSHLVSTGGTELTVSKDKGENLQKHHLKADSHHVVQGSLQWGSKCRDDTELLWQCDS